MLDWARTGAIAGTSATSGSSIPASTSKTCNKEWEDNYYLFECHSLYGKVFFIDRSYNSIVKATWIYGYGERKVIINKFNEFIIRLQ